MSTKPSPLSRSVPQPTAEAEAGIARAASTKAPARSAEELLHELQVHQIELEMQNQALREAQVALEESRDRYVDLYEFAPVGFLTLGGAGQIAEINLTGANLLGENRGRLQHRQFTSFVVAEDRDRWRTHLLNMSKHEGEQRCELRLRRPDGTVFNACLDSRPAIVSEGVPALRIALTDITLPAKAAAELRSSEIRYSSLFANMLDGLAHCRVIFRDGVPVDYEYLAVNPAFEEVSGLEDVVGRKVSEIIADYARDNRVALETFGRVALTGKPERLEHYLGAMDRWFSFAIYSPAAGEFVVISEDVTQRKRAEEQLRKLSIAVEQSPVSIVITDLEARIEYVNPAFSLTSGYAAAEALGQNPRLLKSGRTPPETYREAWATLVAGNVWHGEFINRRKDGTEYIEAATISPLRQADGKVSHYVAVKADITELNQTMAELRASENRLRLAKTAAGLGIYDRDVASGALEWDDRAREIWGVGLDEPITYATFMASLHPDDRAATQAAIDRALDPQGTGEYQAEYRIIRRSDGCVRDVAANGQAIFEGGCAVRLVGTLKDISARKRLEKEMQDRRSEMELLVRQQVAAQTAAAIAHELNQPLVSISAYSEAALRMLRGGSKNPERLSHALEGAMEQAQRAGRTLHDLLDFLHKGETLSEPVDLNEVVRGALAIVEEDGYGGFRPVVELESDLRPVQANRLQVEKVLVNLLHNGVEAMRDAGVPTAAIVIRVQTMAETSVAQVTVQDSGPGLDAETIHRIFDPFFTTKSAGMGLGLAISRALIEAHGGQLWADPEMGRGATFHFTLPFAA